MQEFILWVAQPEAYNWLTLANAAAATLTALFTGGTLLLMWLSRRDRLMIEWIEEYNPSFIHITCSVTNKTENTIVTSRVQVRGPVLSVQPWRNGKAEEKHESWAPLVAPLASRIAPGKTANVSFIIQPDSAALRTAVSSWRTAPRLWLAKVLWKSLGWSLPNGPKLSICLTLRRSSSQIRPIRRTHIIRINAPQALKIAANIEASAPKT